MFIYNDIKESRPVMSEIYLIALFLLHSFILCQKAKESRICFVIGF